MVTLLVKLVHDDCLFDPSNRCRAYLEAKDVNLKNYKALEASVEDFVLERVEVTHKDDNAARNLRFEFFISVSWKINGEAVSRDLKLMSKVDFGLQVLTIKKRDCTDILVVNFRYYVAPGDPGPSRLRVRGRAEVESEGSGKSRGAYDMGEKGQMAYPDYSSAEGDEQPVAPEHEEYDRGDEETMKSVEERDDNSKTRVDSSHQPRTPLPARGPREVKPPGAPQKQRAHSSGVTTQQSVRAPNQTSVSIPEQSRSTGRIMSNPNNPGRSAKSKRGVDREN